MGTDSMPKKTELDRQVTEPVHADRESSRSARHQPAGHAENPKRDPDPGSNTEKDPDDWVTGGEPMTGAQASYLKTLSEQANAADLYEEGLSKAEASKRIDRLREKAGLAR